MILLNLMLVPTMAEEKDKPKFVVRKAEEYPAHQKAEDVTIAAETFATDSVCRQVFEYKDLVSRGILPVLIVVENRSKSAIEIDSRTILLILAESKLQPMELPQLYGLLKKKPSNISLPLPIPKISGTDSKFSLIEGKSFETKRIPPGLSDYGFVFYHLPRKDMWKQILHLYLPRILNMETRQNLLYFEIPLKSAPDQKS